MTDGFAADFDLLPRWPMAFFGLEAGFDKKALKRSYNRLIRSFKPEHHPAEFQLIRAGYETLDEELRSGRTSERAVPLCAPAELAAAATGRPSGYDTLARLAECMPDRVYAELSHLGVKEPHHYFHVAALADIVEEDRPLAFFHWLMEGLRETDGDAGLAALLVEACRGEVPMALVSELLRDLSRLLQGNYYFHVTEPLWMRLVNCAEYSVVLDQFEQLRAEAGEEGLVGSLAVLLGLMKHGVLHGEMDRIQEGMALLEESHHWLPEHLFLGLDLIEALLEYRRHREPFLNGDPLRSRVDATFEAYTTGTVDEAERSFLACQVAIVADPDAALEAFPARGEDFNFVLHPMLWMAREVEERLGVELPPKNEERLQREIHDWMGRIERKTDASTYGKWWNRINLLVLMLAPAVLVLPILAVGLLTPNEAVHGAMLLGWSAFFFVRIRVSWHRFRGERLNPWFAERCYRSVWRSEIARCLCRTQVRAEDLEQRIRAIEDSSITNGPWMTAYMQQDFGIALLSTAVAFSG